MLPEDHTESKETIEAALLQIGVFAYHIDFLSGERLFARVVVQSELDAATLQSAIDQKHQKLSFISYKYEPTRHQVAEFFAHIRELRDRALEKRQNREKANQSKEKVAKGRIQRQTRKISKRPKHK